MPASSLQSSAGEGRTVDPAESQNNSRLTAAQRASSSGMCPATSLYNMGLQACFAMCLAFTVFAAVNISPRRVVLAPARPAVPFFPVDSAVSDFYTGDLGAAFTRAGHHDLALLYFYAPWDNECMKHRADIQKLAEHFRQQVEVIAVNCWQPASSCRKEAKKLTQYPLIMIYLREGKGIQYWGPVEFKYLAGFVERIVRPLVRVETPEQLRELRAKHTAVVVGYTPFPVAPARSSAPPAYFSLLRAALAASESAPLSETAWAVVTNQRAANSLGLAHYPGGVAVINWNHTHVLRSPATGALPAETIRTYVSSRVREMAGWLMLGDQKSALLNQLTSAGAVMLVFTPALSVLQRSSTSGVQEPASNVQEVVRSVWLDYHNCNGSDSIVRLSAIAPTSVHGLVCRTNRTLSVHLVDSVRHRALAHRLGVSVDAHNPAAVILDSADESQYVFQPTSVQSFTVASLADFIANYTANALPRHLASRSQTVPPSSGDIGSCSSDSCHQGLSSAYIRELYTHDFEEIVLDDLQDVVVLFYSVGCGFCSALNHLLLATARLFSQCKLLFTRIDGSSNDLPWHFTMETFPVLLYLPAGRKSESRVFPEDMAPTLTNLARFILANAGVSVRRCFFRSHCDAACRATTAWSAARQVAVVRRRAGHVNERAERARLVRLRRLVGGLFWTGQSGAALQSGSGAAKWRTR